MRCRLLIVIAGFIPLISTAQPVLDTLWVRHYFLNGFTDAREIRQAPDGGYIIAATNCPVTDSASSLALIKLDPSGDLEWYRTWRFPEEDVITARTVSLVSSGGYDIACARGWDDEGRLALIRTAENGDSLWSREFPLPAFGYDHLFLCGLEGDNVEIIYSCGLFGNEVTRYYILDDMGNLISSSWSGELVQCMCPVIGGGCWAGGHLGWSWNSSRAFMKLIGSSGATLSTWEPTRTIGCCDSVYDVTATRDQGAVFVWRNAGHETVLAKYVHGNGNILEWTRPFPYGSTEYQVTECPDGGFYVFCAPPGGQTIQVIRTDSQGTATWTQEQYVGGFHYLWGLIQNDWFHTLLGTSPAASYRMDLARFSSYPDEPYFMLISPNGGEIWDISISNPVSWLTWDAPSAVRIELNRAYPQGIWEILRDSTSNDGLDELIVGPPLSNTCRLRITAIQDTLQDESESDFSIHFFPRVLVLNPNGGEEWRVDTPDTIRWWARHPVSSVRIQLNRDFPSGEWETLADSTPASDGQEVIWLTDPVSWNCRIRITAVGDTFVDESDSDFAIWFDQRLRVIEPNGGEIVPAVSRFPVRWSGAGIPSLMRVELNDSYPEGEWSTLRDSLYNTGACSVEVCHEPSDRCRIRVAAVSDTFMDVSNRDFSIVDSTRILVLEPYGHIPWVIGDSAVVRWCSNNVEGPVDLELQRDYPNGQWDTLTARTENDGVEWIPVTPPGNYQCRIRIRDEAGLLSNVSSWDHYIVHGESVLALCHPLRLSEPVLAWEVIGYPEEPRGSSFYLGNFGYNAISLEWPIVAVGRNFQMDEYPFSHFYVLPGQTSDHTIHLQFMPDGLGIFLDTLLIPSSASNAENGVVRIPLRGQSCPIMSAPVVTIAVCESGIELRWQPICGWPGIIVYLVYQAGDLAGPYQLVSWTERDHFVHTGAINIASTQYYRVIAYDGSEEGLDSLIPGMTEDEVRRRLRE